MKDPISVCQYNKHSSLHYRRLRILREDPETPSDKGGIYENQAPSASGMAQ